MTVLGCKWHPSSDNVGICAHCLRESLSKLAVYQDEEDDSIDLENFPPSMPMPGMGMPAGSRRAQFILVQYNNENGNRGGLAGDNSDLFYPGVNRNAMGALVGGNQHMQPYMPGDHEPTDLHLDGAYHVDMQGEVGSAEDCGSGGHDEAMGHHNMPPTLEVGESGRHKRKLHSSGSGRRKSKGWGAAMMKMIGFRSSNKKAEASSSGIKGNEQGFEDSDEFAAPTNDQQYTPPRFSVSSGLEQTTPARYSVSSQWEQQTTSARYSAAPVHEQVTPARYSGASLFDIESMDSRRFSTSSRGSPFAGKKHVIPGENFNAPWRASKSAANARKMGAYEGFGREENFSSGKASHSPGMRTYGDEGAGQYPGKSPKKSPWKWFSSFKAVTPKEDRKNDWMSSQKKVAVEAISAADSGYQERRKSTSSMYAPKARESAQQPLTPVLTSKKSPWWRSSPRPRTPKTQKSPITIPAKPGHMDQEVATDSDLMEDTPHRRSSASPMVGYSRSSSNGSSCFTTPRWNNRQRPQHSGNRGMAVHEKEHEITHLAI